MIESPHHSFQCVELLGNQRNKTIWENSLEFSNIHLWVIRCSLNIELTCWKCDWLYTQLMVGILIHWLSISSSFYGSAYHFYFFPHPTVANRWLSWERTVHLEGSEMNHLCPTFAGFPGLFMPTMRATELGFESNTLLFLPPFFFWSHHSTCGIFIPQSQIEPRPMAMKAASPNHWTTREFPSSGFF